MSLTWSKIPEDRFSHDLAQIIIALYVFVVVFYYRLKSIKDWIDANDPGATVILFSGEFELKLLDFEKEEDRIAYLKERESQRYEDMK